MRVARGPCVRARRNGHRTRCPTCKRMVIAFCVRYALTFCSARRPLCRRRRRRRWRDDVNKRKPVSKYSEHYTALPGIESGRTLCAIVKQRTAVHDSTRPMHTRGAKGFRCVTSACGACPIRVTGRSHAHYFGTRPLERRTLCRHGKPGKHVCSRHATSSPSARLLLRRCRDSPSRRQTHPTPTADGRRDKT